MFLDILELRAKNKIESLDKTDIKLLSLILEKSGFKCASVTIKKYSKIVPKTWNCQQYIADSEALKSMISNVWGNFLIVNLYLALIFVSVTRHLEVLKHE